VAANSERIIGLEPDGSVPVTIVSGGGTGGTASTFGALFPPTGTAAGFIDNGGNMAGGTLDASGYLKVNVAAGSSGNAAASATGAAVPASADYQGVNVGGNLVGATGVTAGSITSQHVIGSGAAGTPATGVVTVQGIANMTKLLVTPDSVALPANQSVNLAQVNGTTTVNGGSAAGILAVGGPNATNVAITGNPTNNGAQAVSAENAAVTAGRLVQLVADLAGKLIVLPYANPENFVSGAITSAMTGTTTTSLLAAPASGLRNYITQITVSNGSTTVPTDIVIQDGSGGTTLYTVPAPIGTGTGTGTSGGSFTFPVPLRQPTTATAIFVANVTTGSSTKVSASGYKGI
jgi:hypothetical protein